MTDIREDIIDRLVATLDAVPGLTVKRNETEVDSIDRPAAIVNDGDEEERESSSRDGRAAQAMVMRPEITLYISSAASPGSVVNQWRTTIVKAILFDAQLLALAGPHGSVRYTGCETDLTQAEQVEANMLLRFAITYRFKPAEL
jgi:hypothetical protein